MGKQEKRFNKRLIGIVIGSAVVGGLSTTKKGKSFWKRSAELIFKPMGFMKRGLREMRKDLQKSKKS